MATLRARADHMDIPSRIWDLPSTQEALISGDLGGVFSVILQETGWAQEALGHVLGMDQARVSRYVRGQHAVTSVDVVRRAIEGLGMPVHATELLLLGVFGRNPGSNGGQEEAMDQRRRDFLTAALAAALAGGTVVAGALGDAGPATAAAQTPDGTTADHLHGLTTMLAEQSRVRPIPGLLPMSAALATMAEGCLTTAADRHLPSVGRAAADAMALRWWFLFNTGQLDAAGLAQAKAMQMAAVWDVPAVIGAMLARQADSTDDPRVRLQLARRALTYDLPPLGQFEARWSIVEASVLLGDPDATARAVEEAMEARAHVVPGCRGGDLVLAPFTDMDEEHLTLSGWTIRMLAEGPGAAGALESALAGFSDDRLRDLAYFQGVLASSYALAGDVDGALPHADAAARHAVAAGTVLPLTSALLPAVARRPRCAPWRRCWRTTASPLDDRRVTAGIYW
jgi:transcriptional regulator with XRE-family HTH domain